MNKLHTLVKLQKTETYKKKAQKKVIYHKKSLKTILKNTWKKIS